MSKRKSDSTLREEMAKHYLLTYEEFVESPLHKKLEKAFKKLEDMGYVTKMSFMCSRNCAASSICTEVSEMPEDEARKFKGTVFFSEEETDYFLRSGDLYIPYGYLITQYGNIGKKDKEIGEDAAKVLRDCGIEVKWNGNPKKTIMVRDRTLVPR